MLQARQEEAGVKIGADIAHKKALLQKENKKETK